MALALGVTAAACSRRDPPPPPPPPPPLEVDRDVLADAMRQCFTADCDRAHALVLQISADSPLRQSDEFRAIEYHYEVDQLLRAEGEPNIDDRRAKLDRFRNLAEADPALRTAAAAMLARLGGGARFELTLSGQGDAGAPDADADADRAEKARIATLMRTKKPADYQTARSLIEPRIFSGKASPDDLRNMTIICKAQKDATCLKTVKTLQLR
jgi:hypothetical protein